MHSIAPTWNTVEKALHAYGVKGRYTSNGAWVHCPVCRAQGHTLSIIDDWDRLPIQATFECSSGCSALAILTEIGLGSRDARLVVTNSESFARLCHVEATAALLILHPYPPYEVPALHGLDIDLVWDAGSPCSVEEMASWLETFASVVHVVES